MKEPFGFPIAIEDDREALAADVDLCAVASATGLHHEHARATRTWSGWGYRSRPPSAGPCGAGSPAELAFRG